MNRKKEKNKHAPRAVDVEQSLTSRFFRIYLSEMNLAIVIFSIIVILLGVFWAWFKLKDTEEDELIDIGF